MHRRGQNYVFLKFGYLEGDFYNETHEAKLFVMHNGSVLSGLEKCQNDQKMPILGCKHTH